MPNIAKDIPVTFGVSCQECEKSIDVIAPANQSGQAMSDLKAKLQDNNWEVLSLGKRPVGLLCPACSDEIMAAVVGHEEIIST